MHATCSTVGSPAATSPLLQIHTVHSIHVSEKMGQAQVLRESSSRQGRRVIREHYRTAFTKRNKYNAVHVDAATADSRQVGNYLCRHRGLASRGGEHQPLRGSVRVHLDLKTGIPVNTLPSTLTGGPATASNNLCLHSA